MKFTAVATTALACLATQTLAFAPASTARALARSSSSARTIVNKSIPVFVSTSSDANAKSQTEEEESLPVEKAESTPLDPEFAGAFEKTIGTLKAAIDNEALLTPLIYFVKEYFVANQKSMQAGNEIASAGNTAERIMNVIQLGMKYGMGPDKYLFGVSHEALRGKGVSEEDVMDFYEFGCDFFKPCMDLDKSLILGEDNLEKAFDQVKAGENVVFFANHQSEADPQVFSILLESIGLGEEASEVVYIAGHKVTTDPLAIPFSMGRNLLCIHSKKHIDADPETKSVKQRQNLRTMNDMLRMMKEGGTALWVAPSGGRDRRDLETGKVPIAHYDSKTIDMFRLMGRKSKTPTHYYPLSMISYDLCPPPDYIVAGVGEERNVRFEPVAIACGEELENVGGLESRHLFAENAEKDTDKGYQELLSKMKPNAE